MHVASSWRLNGDMLAVADVSFEAKRRSIFYVAFGLAGDGRFEFLGEAAIGLDPEAPSASNPVPASGGKVPAGWR